MSKLKLTLAMGDYEITRALKEGTVQPDGIELNVLTAMDSTTRHWRFPVSGFVRTIMIKERKDVKSGAYRDRGSVIVAGM